MIHLCIGRMWLTSLAIDHGHDRSRGRLNEVQRTRIKIFGGSKNLNVRIMFVPDKKCSMCTYLLVMRVRRSMVDVMYGGRRVHIYGNLLDWAIPIASEAAYCLMPSLTWCIDAQDRTQTDVILVKLIRSEHRSSTCEEYAWAVVNALSTTSKKEKSAEAPRKFRAETHVTLPRGSGISRRNRDKHRALLTES